MKNILYIIIPFLFACNGAKKETEKNEQTQSDTAIAVNVSAAVAFDEKLFKELKTPLEIDTTFITKCDTNEKFSYELVRLLGKNILKHDAFNSIDWQLNGFCEIDSLKQNGLYEDYIKKLDIGMTKNSIAFKIGMISLIENSKLFLWGIESSSYEACPFHSGKTVIATFTDENKNNTHFIIGEIYGAGDPPSMLNKTITGKVFADGKIEVKSVTVSDDIDTPGEETTTEIINLDYTSGKLLVKETKKDVKNTEKAN